VLSDKESAQIEPIFKKAKADTARTNAQFFAQLVEHGPERERVASRAHRRDDRRAKNPARQEVRSDAPAPWPHDQRSRTVWVQADVYEQDRGP